jgi:hypothetical protein
VSTVRRDDRDVTTAVASDPIAVAPRRLGHLLDRWRAARPPRWWEEIAFVVLAYWLYSLVRNTVPTHELAAFHRARDILGFERSLHIDIERSVNAFVASVHPLAYVANYYYATLHFIVTIGVLVWLYRRHPLRYRSLRSVLFATNIIALLGFWLYALAPPRMLASDGFTDTVVVFHTWGSWASGDVASASNQFAAMPSLHIAWALWCGVVVVALARRLWVRVLGALYPLATLLVIMGTANHFVVDAVGGALVLALGFAIQRVLSGRAVFALPHQALASSALSAA